MTLGVDLINTANNPTLNKTQPSSTEVSSQTNKSDLKQKEVSSNVIGIECNSGNQIASVICSDRDLIEINNKYQNYVSVLKTKNIDNDLLKENVDELNRKISECNLNKQCIYFSFQEANIGLQNLDK